MTHGDLAMKQVWKFARRDRQLSRHLSERVIVPFSEVFEKNGGIQNGLSL
jgi:hypothetical protein